MSEFQGFGPTLVTFLEQLREHNERSWFDAHRERYEDTVREPARAFIRTMAPALAAISPHFRADDRKVGGSLMRAHRDTRFSRSKIPYKTNVGILFRHEAGRDVHAPGFYVHIEPDDAFLGAGVWHPASDALHRIRSRIDEKPDEWRRVRDGQAFVEHYALGGERLKTMPRGFARDHALAEDLRRKDFIAIHPLPIEAALAPDFADLAAARFAAAGEFVHFLCKTLDVPF